MSRNPCHCNTDEGIDLEVFQGWVSGGALTLVDLNDLLCISDEVEAAGGFVMSHTWKFEDYE